MIDLKKLIKAAEFPPDLKDQLLTAVDAFSPEKKFELENICWNSISAKYHSDLDFKLQSKALDAGVNGTPFSTDDARKIKDETFKELIRNLEAVEDNEKIDEVRQKLQAQTPNSN